MPQATVLFAGLLTLIYIFLTINVIRMRWRYRAPYGASPEHHDLVLAQRAHGNFQEYTPLFLILLYLEESNFHTEWACYLLGALYTAGRISHSYSMIRHEKRSMLAGESVGRNFKFRFYAMTHTFAPLGILALMLLVQWALFQSVRLQP